MRIVGSAKPEEVIRLDEAYTKDEFLKRVKWGDDAFCTARINGLRVAESGRAIFVTGSDWLEFLARDEKTAPIPKRKSKKKKVSICNLDAFDLAIAEAQERELLKFQ